MLSISIPAISQKYDLWIPADIPLKTAVPLIANTVEELSNHRYVASGNEKLCSAEKNTVLKSDVIFAQYGIQNGDHLIMI